MACRKCGSDWVTATGKDCKTCPSCCKQQRCKARKEGRWSEPTAEKLCRICNQKFIAVGLHDIENQHVCLNPECKKTNRRRIVKASKDKRAAGIFTLPREPGPQRHCKRLCCGKLLTRRDQKDYCSRTCAGADAREYKRAFRGFAATVRQAAAFASWFVDVWEPQRPHLRKDYKPRPPCEVCGEETNERHSRFCSRSCMKKWRGPRQCKCGVTVENAKAYARPSCGACKQKARAAYRRHLKRLIGDYRKRCKKYGGFYNSKCKRKDILMRDKYLCHLCGRKCRNDANWNHPRAATVDHHPVPLSKGGDHDWHNVRCACRKCNSEKSNKWDGQRRLRLALSP
jgi:hypothetical protein